ncbi:MAG: 1-phosphofructokinase family hexose kinase [Microbacterium sp.]
MITAIALSPSLDSTYVVDRLEGIRRPEQVVRVGGGKALNAARAARTLGASDVEAIAVLAGGAGWDVAESVRHAGVTLTPIDGSAPTRTCVSIFSRETGALTELYERAVPLTAEDLDAVVDRVEQAARVRGGWFLLSGGMPPGVSSDAIARLVRAVRGHGGRIAVDTHGPALRAAVAAEPDLVKVNRAEAAELLGGDPASPGSELVAALSTAAGGGRLVVVTDGTAGSWASDGSRVLRSWPGDVVGDFPVGSGDSFLGGLLRSLDAGGGLDEAVALAAAAGTANALEPGAAVLDPALARRLAAAMRVALSAS